jgi:hypothetical protein
VRDPFSPASHVFLLPSEGVERMLDLHDRLYSGVFAKHLHPTARFRPHVTVGGFDRHQDAERTAGSLAPFDISGALQELCVARFDGAALKHIKALQFGA